MARLNSVLGHHVDYSDIELHDAWLASVTADYVGCSVTVSIEYCPSPDASVRVAAAIRFDGVTRFNEISDFDELQSHASAGNISHWVPAVGPGTTYIYLVRGSAWHLVILRLRRARNRIVRNRAHSARYKSRWAVTSYRKSCHPHRRGPAGCSRLRSNVRRSKRCRPRHRDVRLPAPVNLPVRPLKTVP